MEVKDLFKETSNKKLQELKENSVKRCWEKIKEGLKETADEVLGRKESTVRKEWMTEEIIELIYLRRNLKSNNTEESQEEYRKVRNEINRKTKLAKKKHFYKRNVTR